MVEMEPLTADHGDSQEVEQRIRSMMDSLTKSSEATTDNLVAYQQRLETFRPSTYFAKPPSLSPIVCARFGWTNVDEDLVVCSECKAALVIQIHPNLSTSAARDVCRSIEVELAKAHLLDCSFRSDAEKHLLVPSSTESNDNMVPAYMASILPPSTLELMEHPAPHQQLRERVLKLTEHLGLAHNSESASNKDPTTLRPVIESPRALSEFNISNQEGQDPDATLLSRIARILELPTADEPAVMLALFGWEPTISVVDDSQPPRSEVKVKCQVCLASAEVTVEAVTASSTEEKETSTRESATIGLLGENAGDGYDQQKDGTHPNATKRLRTSGAALMNPILSHRHYCPFVCGFPPSGSWSATPLWKKIASRILQTDATTMDPNYRVEDSAERIHTMLKAGIVSNSSKRMFEIPL